MSTIMLFRETLPAEKRSVEDSRRAVDRLMEYDRKLSEDFTVEELRKLFPADDRYPGDAREDYSALTEAEKLAVAALGFVPPETPDDGLPRADAASVADRRRYLKAAVIEKPVLDDGDSGGFFGGNWSFHGDRGRIYVWLDSMCFGNSDKTGFYYVRDQLSVCDGTTAYAHPLLIVQKKKLRPDQIDYMERKRRETREIAECEAARRRGSGPIA